MKINEMACNDWIPSCERLPESNEPEVVCLVTYQDYNLFEGKWECRKVGVMSYLTKHQIWNTKALVKVLAWMPPEGSIVPELAIPPEEIYAKMFAVSSVRVKFETVIVDVDIFAL